MTTLLTRDARAAEYGKLIATQIPGTDVQFELAEEFTYQVLELEGDAMSGGGEVPGAPDGMACFLLPDGNWALMRNHELGTDGGVTRVVIDPDTVEVLSSNTVLVGTVRNCAGGVSPWGWLTCEESGTGGQVYLASPDSTSEQELASSVIPNYGSFNHEAAAVHPESIICYLTEDEGSSSFFRFVPDSKETPFEGRLQALRVGSEGGTDRFRTDDMTRGDSVEGYWVDVPDPASARNQARSAGSALFSRGEGLWIHEDQIYICSTDGGASSQGQIFRMIDRGDDCTLECIVVGDSDNGLDSPDNITIAPWGELFMAEDQGAGSSIQSADEEGGIFRLARNDSAEFTGVCFSPDGKVMFVNIQRPGITLAITGPFPEVGDGGDSGTGETGGEDSGDTDGLDSSTSDSPPPGTGGDGGASASDGAATDAAGDDAGTGGTSGGATSDTDSAGLDSADSDSGCSVTGKPGIGGALLSAAAIGLGRRRKTSTSDTEDV